MRLHLRRERLASGFPGRVDIVGWSRRAALTLALALGLFQPVAAATAAQSPADRLVKADVEQISALLREKAYSVEQQSDDDGNPYIRTSYEKRAFNIYFFGCGAGVRPTGCTSIQFYAAFTLGRPFPPERMNEWNRGHRFGRGYIDDVSDPAVEMDVNLDAGGVPLPLFLDTLELWLDVFTGFDDFVFETPKTDSEAAPATPIAAPSKSQ